MGYRTFNPWGHVSKAERARRMRDYKMVDAWMHIVRVPDGEKLFNEFKELVKKGNPDIKVLSEQEKLRVNEIADYFNKNGVTDRQLEECL